MKSFGTLFQHGEEDDVALSLSLVLRKNDLFKVVCQIPDDPTMLFLVDLDDDRKNLDEIDRFFVGCG